MKRIPGQLTETERRMLARASRILERYAAEEPADYITTPQTARDLLRYRLTGRQAEVFSVLYLDNRHGIITIEEPFHGTIDGASVYPREIVRRALEVGAAAVIFAHNHPSGDPEPSSADVRITQRLRDALALIDVRTLDHIIIGRGEPVSLALRGLI